MFKVNATPPALSIEPVDESINQSFERALHMQTNQLTAGVEVAKRSRRFLRLSSSAASTGSSIMDRFLLLTLFPEDPFD